MSHLATARYRQQQDLSSTRLVHPVIGTDARPDAADVLRRCQVPPDEIRRVLTADDPAAVHMILELHRERLEEELEAWLTEEDGARLLEP